MSRIAANIIIALILLGIGAAVGVAGYIWFVGGSGEASSAIAAPTLSLDRTQEPLAEVVQLSTSVAQLNAQVEQLSSQVQNNNNTLSAQLGVLVAAEDDRQATRSALENLPTSTPTLVPSPTFTPEPSATATEESARTLFRIVPEDSEVRFLLDEDLRGQRVTVIGSTNQVAGDIIVDFDSPANSQVGTIRINARTLATDNEFRNRALRSQILQSAQAEYEFVEFKPAALENMPVSVDIGEPFSFQLIGDLTIRSITHLVTFDVTVTPVSETQLEGSAKAVVTRADYELTIPSVPGVANVEEEVELEIDFTAQAVES